MARIEEIIGVMVRDCQGVNARETPEKTIWSVHEIGFLDESPDCEKHNIGKTYSIGPPIHCEESHIGDNHQVHEERGINDVCVL